MDIWKPQKVKYLIGNYKLLKNVFYTFLKTIILISISQFKFLD